MVSAFKELSFCMKSMVLSPTYGGRERRKLRGARDEKKENLDRTEGVSC